MIESVRWGAVIVLDEALASPDNWALILGAFCDACVTSWLPTSQALREWLEPQMHEKVRSGALPLSDLIRLVDDHPEFREPLPADCAMLRAPEDVLDWYEKFAADLQGVRLDGQTGFWYALLLFMKALMGTDLQDWRERLVGGEKQRIETYTELCTAMIGGAALSRHVIPPWMEEGSLAKVLRASWEGPDAYAKAASLALHDMGINASPNHRRAQVVVAEMQRRGWGDDPMTLAPERMLELSRWLHQNPEWIDAGEDNEA